LQQKTLHSIFAILNLRLGLVGFLSLLVICLAILSASPQLHESLHTDAHHADHHCAIQMFVHGQVDAAPVAAVLDVVTFQPVPSATPCFSPFLTQAKFRLLPGRAPPRI